MKERSAAVYCIPCRDCNFVYIGETGLHLSTRIKQHREATHKCVIEKSAISQHAWTKHHQINWDGVSVLDSDPYTKSRKIREALHIRKRSSETKALKSPIFGIPLLAHKVALILILHYHYIPKSPFHRSSCILLYCLCFHVCLETL